MNLARHKHLSAEVSETIKIWEQIGGKIRKEKQFHVKFMTRSEPTVISSVDGVTVTWSADKKTIYGITKS